MIGILVITHGDFAKGIKSAADMIMGEQPNFSSLGLQVGEDYDDFKANVYQAIVERDEGDGVLVLVDFFGASPYNAVGMNTSKLREEGHQFRLVTGVNLPMLIEALDARSRSSLDELYPLVMETAKENIKEMFTELGL